MQCLYHIANLIKASSDQDANKKHLSNMVGILKASGKTADETITNLASLLTFDEHDVRALYAEVITEEHTCDALVAAYLTDSMNVYEQGFICNYQNCVEKFKARGAKNMLAYRDYILNIPDANITMPEYIRAVVCHAYLSVREISEMIDLIKLRTPFKNRTSIRLELEKYILPEAPETIEGEEIANIGGKVYLIRSNAYYARNDDYEYKMSDFVVSQDVHYQNIDINKPSPMIFTVRLENGERFDVRLSSVEYVSGQELYERIVRQRGSVYVHNILRGQNFGLLHTLVSFGSKGRRIQPIAEAIGLCSYKDSRMYLLSDGAICHNDSQVDVQYLPSATSGHNYRRFIKPYERLSAKVGLDSIDTEAIKFLYEKLIHSNRANTVRCIIAYIASAPFMNELVEISYQRFYLFLFGESGLGKTEVVRKCMCLLGDFGRKANFMSFTSTPNAIFNELSKIKGLVVVIDNFVREKLQHGEINEISRRIIGYADGSGRSRSRVDGSAKDADTIESNLIITGEHTLEAGTSVSGRGLEIPYENGDYLLAPEDEKIFNQTVSSSLPDVFVGYLRDAIRIPVEEIDSDVMAIKSKFMERISERKTQNMGRMATSAAIMCYSLRKFMDFMGRFIDISESETIIKSTEKYLLERIMKQIDTVESMKQWQVFMRAVRNKIVTKEKSFNVVAVDRQAETKVLLVESTSDNVYAYCDDNYYYIPTAIFEHPDFKRPRFLYSQSQITRQLKDEQVLKEHDGKDLPQFTVKHGSAVKGVSGIRMYVIARELIDQD